MMHTENLFFIYLFIYSAFLFVLIFSFSHTRTHIRELINVQIWLTQCKVSRTNGCGLNRAHLHCQSTAFTPKLAHKYRHEAKPYEAVWHLALFRPTCLISAQQSTNNHVEKPEYTQKCFLGMCQNKSITDCLTNQHCVGQLDD